MFKEHEVVVLKAPTPEIPLPAGTSGTVLIVFDDTPPAYEVEFTDDDGKSFGVFTARQHDLLPWKAPQDKPAASS